MAADAWKMRRQQAVSSADALSRRTKIAAHAGGVEVVSGGFEYLASPGTNAIALSCLHLPSGQHGQT